VVLVNVGPRPLFFGFLSIVCAVLLPFTPPEYRWVNWAMIALAIFWGVMLGIEELAAARDLRRRAQRQRRSSAPD
jgi:hypothetical protein